MHKNLLALLSIFILGILGIVAFVVLPNLNVSSREPSPQPNPAVVIENKPDEIPSESEPPAQKVGVPFEGKQLATNYYVFEKSDYARLLKEGRPVLLFFYANWCPTCASQEPIMIETMNEGLSNGVIALRVNYNDTETSPGEKALAEQFVVTYQHTFVSINNGGHVVNKVTGQQSKEELTTLFSDLQ